MKGYLLKLLILFLIICSFGSCNDPIFYTVTEETPVIKPLIDGSPTKFAIFNNEMYVATGNKIFKYSGNKWSKWKTSNGFVLDLTSTGNSLYALYLSGSSGRIRRYDISGNSTEETSLSGNVQSIYAFGNILFVCVRNNTTYTVFYKKEGDANFKEIPIKISGTEPLYYILNGVASDSSNYYLCTFSGIFHVDKNDIDSSSVINSSSVQPIKNKDGKTITGFTGIINLNSNCIAAITKGGVLYEIANVATEKIRFRDGRYSTGALAIWQDKNDPTKTLLLVGRSEDYFSTTSSYSNGYVEITFGTYDVKDPDTGTIIGTKFGILPDASFRDPGKNPISSISGYDRYVSSLGKKLINFFIQTPASIDTEMTMFASTQKDGVWSYRNHNDGEGITWNAEK